MKEEIRFFEWRKSQTKKTCSSMCPRSLRFYIATHYVKIDKTSWTYSTASEPFKNIFATANTSVCKCFVYVAFRISMYLVCFEINFNSSHTGHYISEHFDLSVGAKLLYKPHSVTESVTQEIYPFFLLNASRAYLIYSISS